MALHTAEDKTDAILAASVLMVGGAAVLAGCMAQTPPPPPGRPVQVEAGEAGMGFFLNSTADEGMKLAYGRAGSDDVWLMLECRPGSRKIDILDARHPEARRGGVLTLSSGQMQSALPVTAEPDDSGDGVTLVAHATPDLPALEGFRRSGVLAVKLGAREYALAASPREKALVARFFAACERK